MLCFNNSWFRLSEVDIVLRDDHEGEEALQGFPVATPNYFSKLPNVKCLFEQSVNKAGHVNYITTKDFFGLVMPKDDVPRRTPFTPVMW